jgi:hypothetical protein
VSGDPVAGVVRSGLGEGAGPFGTGPRRRARRLELRKAPVETAPSSPFGAPNLPIEFGIWNRTSDDEDVFIAFLRGPCVVAVTKPRQFRWGLG